jgi:pimeloyl-ACP methyl ester carboxylesterase
MVAMDLRGRGLSGKPPNGYSVRHHCRDILQVLDDLKLDQPVVMGHSLGALIAAAFAAWHPERVDRIILIDGAGALTKEQMDQVMHGIKPSLARLGQSFPSMGVFLDLMKKAPFLQPWSPELDHYFGHDVEEVDGVIQSRIDPEHMSEEIENLKKIDAAALYPKIRCPVLILRATDGMLADDDLVLPLSAVNRMCSEIDQTQYINLTGTNHYSILFQPNDIRDQTIKTFINAK